MLQLCFMSNKGKILKQIFKDTGLKVAQVARKMDVDRGTIYRHFDEEDLSLDYIIKYGKAMKVDMNKYFPEISSIVLEDEVQYMLEKPTYSELETRLDHWKDKYIQLLEKYNELLLEKNN